MALATAIAAVGACTLGAAGTGAAAPARAAFVRVNQAGYPIVASKRAYLLARVARPGATFRVTNARGHTVLSGAVGPALGSWSARYPHVYAVDFTRLRAAGRYTISVAGAAASPPFRVAGGARLSRQPLRNSLAFYQDERDGPDFIRTPLRTAPGHLNDEHAMTYLTPEVDGDGNFAGNLHPLGVRIDASGGWWDAGDYLKFVETTGYTDAVVLAAVRDFPRQMRVRVHGHTFAAEAAFGARWLLRMWDDRTRTLYYQVGIGEANDQTLGDHDIWRLPQADDTYGGTGRATRYIRHRPVFRAGPPGSPVSPNLAGRDAAAFGLCFQVYRRTHPALAARCLRSGEHVFALADTTPGRLLTVIPFDFYPETEWRDDLELGATELAIATARGGLPAGLPHRRSAYYLRLAAHWAHAYITGPNDAADTLNLYDTSGLAHYDLYRAIRAAHDPHGLRVTPAALLADLRRQLGRAEAQGAGDPFGFGFPWAQYDTASHGFGLAVEAGEYDQLTHGRRYADDASRWLANVLGANAWGVSLAVGDGTTDPHCMQHQVANLVGSLDGSGPMLAGAVVEGPNSEATTGVVPPMRLCPGDGTDRFARFNSAAVFRDNVQSYSTVEPAIDLTATSPLAFARQAARNRAGG
ncbi:MAG TPA: glycoside hydrolase family 9 protein [Gaiellales bacterium]